MLQVATVPGSFKEGGTDINGIPWDAPWETVCMRYRGRALTGRYKHYCHEWDGLPIDENDEEFDVCHCFAYVDPQMLGNWSA